MTDHILDFPNEILHIIVSHVINGDWKNDVRDFLSFTSTCHRLYDISHNERYWHKMVLRRDPTNEKPSNILTWLDYCKKIYLMRTIARDDMKDDVSQYNDDYFCTIKKVLLWPGKIRIYIDERGNSSLGDIQYPMSTQIAFVEPVMCYYNGRDRILPSESEFTIEDPKSQYLGYLDFFVDLTSDYIGKILIFQYGVGGYSIARLFLMEQTFIDKYNLSPLMKQAINNA
ncbi:hypothetical protein I4U23_013163 [Adineta vaga]|nr:hypothetical protein I4U23_013163 [Adineta vaga]